MDNDLTPKKGREVDVDTDEGQMHAEEGEVDSNIPLIDAGTGDTHILRTFSFKMNPENKKIPTNQELFNSHWTQIKALLWGDGLIANEEVEPRIALVKGSYDIHVLCQPRMGAGGTRTLVHEKPQTLQDIFKDDTK